MSANGSTLITLPNNNTNCLDGSGICNDELLKDIYKRVMGSKESSNRSKITNDSSEQLNRSRVKPNGELFSSGGNPNNSNINNNSVNKCVPCELLKEKIINVHSGGYNTYRGGHDDPNHIPSDIKGEPTVTYTPVKPDDPEAKKALDVLAEKFSCPKGDESCVINKAAKEGIIEKHEKHKALAVIKPKGPINGEWLSDADIWKIMCGWKELHPNFYPINYAMLDFMDYPDIYELANFNPVDILKDGKNCFGCVCNTDKHVGNGIHWVAIFGDMRGSSEWTVEFFNSTGKIYEPFVKFTERAASQLSKYQPSITSKAVLATRKEHQQSDSECGLYSLYYIYARLILKKPYTMFDEVTVTDINMFTFRKSLFANGTEEIDTTTNTTSINTTETENMANGGRITKQGRRMRFGKGEKRKQQQTEKRGRLTISSK